MGYICTRCGGTNVACEAIVNPNTGKIIDLKGGIIETSKQIKIGIEEARRMWQMVSLLHRGGQFRHGLVEDVGGNKWSINRYENDILTAGCHRIAYSEMESIAKQLGWA